MIAGLQFICPIRPIRPIASIGLRLGIGLMFHGAASVVELNNKECIRGREDCSSHPLNRWIDCHCFCVI